MKFLFRKNKVENVIFLHMPKAGGTTLRHIFYDQYKYLNENEIYTINRTKETSLFHNIDKNEKQKIKLLIGHMPFGLHNNLNNNFNYITFLRNPIERVISAYFYNKENESSDVFEQINSKNFSLYDYLLNNIEPWSMNAMTKHLYGCNEQQFKENCTDIRNAGIYSVINRLKKFKCKLNLYDPWADKLEIKKIYNTYPISKLYKNEYDSVIIAVAHEKFKDLGIKFISSLCKKNYFIYDLKSLFSKTSNNLRL